MLFSKLDILQCGVAMFPTVFAIVSKHAFSTVEVYCIVLDYCVEQASSLVDLTPGVCHLFASSVCTCESTTVCIYRSPLLPIQNYVCMSSSFNFNSLSYVCQIVTAMEEH